MKYTYPLKLHFKLFAFAPQIKVTDADEKEILYIEQKLFAMREAINVYNNETEKKPLYTIKANQIIDFGAKYVFRVGDKEFGSVQQDGMKSLVQASYSISEKNDHELYKIEQTNPLIAILDSIINMVPYLGLLTGFFLNPTYIVTQKESKTPIMTMKKKPSFFESNFDIELHQKDLSEDQEQLILLSFLMVVQLERNRG